MPDLIGFVCYLFNEDPIDFVIAVSFAGILFGLFFDFEIADF